MRGDRRAAGPRGARRRRRVHRRTRAAAGRRAGHALGRTPDSLAPIRYLLRRWLLARGATEDEAYDVIVATQEACANAIEHAYGPGRAEFAVDASDVDGRVAVTVTDRGQWRAPRGSNRGRGLPLMRELMDTVDVSHSERGTAVTLVTTLGSAPA